MNKIHILLQVIKEHIETTTKHKVRVIANVLLILENYHISIR